MNDENLIKLEGILKRFLNLLIYEEYLADLTTESKLFIQSLSKYKKRYDQSTMCDHIRRSLALGILLKPLTTISTTFEKFLKSQNEPSVLTSCPKALLLR